MLANIICNRSRGCVVSFNSPRLCPAGQAGGIPFTLLAAVALALILDAVPAENARAAEADPAALSLYDAADLAVAAQPLLDAQRSAVSSSQESAIAAAQLPDPMLVGGLNNLTITGPDRFTLRRETDTQFTFAVKQNFPGGKKRELRGARARAESDRLDTELEEQMRMVRRETGLAWLDAWKALQAQELVLASGVEAQRQLELAEINYRAGRATQADILAARVALELLEDQRAGLQQQEWHGRNQLRRWIGVDADRPIHAGLPPWSEPDITGLLDRLEQHPQIAAQARAVDVASAELKLAHEEYKPDWSIQVGYGYRPEFSDYALVQFETALPFFTRNRQDRVATARAAEVTRTELLWEDTLRQHRASVQLNVTDWQRLQKRLARFDNLILPQAQQRLDAALAAYGAGSGLLLGILDARRSLLDIRMQRLELEFDAARHQVELQYFSDVIPEESQS